MQSRLIVKNFGPIVHVDLDLRNVNVFIGPQASGKSALAKLFTICKAPRRFFKSGDATEYTSAFKAALEEYNIGSFLTPNSEIQFESDLHVFSLYEKNIRYEQKLKMEVDSICRFINNKQGFDWSYSSIRNEIEKQQQRYGEISVAWTEMIQEPNFDRKFDFYLKIVQGLIGIEERLSLEYPLYISSERNFINMFRSASLNLLLNNVPIPRHILLLGAEIEKAGFFEIDLGFLCDNLKYKEVNGEGRVFLNDTNSIKLTEAASGVQSIIPLLIPILSDSRTSSHRSYIIEEPELNLSPVAQYELIKLLESRRDEVWTNDVGNVHLYTTHSPYVLSAFNNLLYASKVWNLRGPHAKDSDDSIVSKLSTIIPPKANVQPSVFSAYQISNGRAESIFDRESGLIVDNYIDAASDSINDDFDALMDMLK